METALSANNELSFVNHPAADWLTLTTWNYREWRNLYEYIGAKIAHHAIKTASKLQYSGARWLTDCGSFFYGIGTQMGHNHCIIEVSGGLSQLVIDALLMWEGFNPENWRCTRIDVQVTRRIENWDSKALFDSAKEAGLTVGWASSRSNEHGELATVYIGSQKSGRFARVYQKVVDEQVLIRGEIVFRTGGGSDTLFHRIMGFEPNYTLANAYSGAISAINQRALEPLEANARPELPRVIRYESKTVKWLLDVVLPVFKRVVSQHDGAASVVAMAFADCIRQCKSPSWEWVSEVEGWEG